MEVGKERPMQHLIGSEIRETHNNELLDLSPIKWTNPSCCSDHNSHQFLNPDYANININNGFTSWMHNLHHKRPVDQSAQGNKGDVVICMKPFAAQVPMHCPLKKYLIFLLVPWNNGSEASAELVLSLSESCWDCDMLVAVDLQKFNWVMTWLVTAVLCLHSRLSVSVSCHGSSWWSMGDCWNVLQILWTA